MGMGSIDSKCKDRLIPDTETQRLVNSTVNSTISSNLDAT